MTQKLNFGKTRYVFVSSLDPDHFAGFAGYYLSALNENGGDWPKPGATSHLIMTVMGPEGLRNRLL